jgi:MerR family transcriptional regulator, copper efflux regulator
MAASSGRYHLTLAHPAGEPPAIASGTLPSGTLLSGAGPAGLPSTPSLSRSAEPGGQTAHAGSEAECLPQQLLRVGDLAKVTGKTVRAIHHYEELGLIEPAGRSKGHYRLFDADTPVRIRWIGKLQSLGLSLGEIRTLVRTRQASPSALQAAGHLRRMYEEKLVEVRSRLAELSALERELSASLSYLDACGTSCAPELGPTDCAQCDRHAEEQHSDLISGALV